MCIRDSLTRGSVKLIVGISAGISKTGIPNSSARFSASCETSPINRHQLLRRQGHGLPQYDRRPGAPAAAGSQMCIRDSFFRESKSRGRSRCSLLAQQQPPFLPGQRQKFHGQALLFPHCSRGQGENLSGKDVYKRQHLLGSRKMAGLVLSCS